MAAVFVIAHEPLASALVASARHVYSRNAQSPCRRLVALDIPPDGAFDAMLRAAQTALDQAEGVDAGVLILTDLLGATPANVAQHLAHPAGVSVLAGVNLSMLLRALCYIDKSLPELEAKALDGALKGVQALSSGNPPQDQETEKMPDSCRA